MQPAASVHGRALSEIERAIIDMAISTMQSGQRAARAQLALAAYGGPAHPGSHVCFLIDVPDGMDKILPERSVLDLEVDSSSDNPIEISLFIEYGRLASLDLTAYASGTAASVWPTLERIRRPAGPIQ